MIDEKERLVESAKESMMLKLTLKNQIMMKWESPENKVNAETDSESPDHSHPRMFSLNQIRQLFYMHMHRCDLKPIVEKEHPARMKAI